MGPDDVPTLVSDTDLEHLLPTAPELQEGDQTIRPAPPEIDPTATLPTLPLKGSGAAKPYLDLLGELGQGGAAIVHLAEQIPLGRQVAVKSLKSTSARASVELLREARITGLLEHPNIVPVYTLGQNADGLPMLVMKRVEGRSWRELLRAERQPDGSLDEAGLRRHLELLLQVAHAVSFAHAKGVVHRDLKPENVMVGAFGEVYVLDWGIAVTVGDATQADGLAGTPAYMAPEMALGELAKIGPHTDVYLLGAILHELLVGARRHQGRNLGEIMRSVLDAAPFPYPDRAPAELVAICRRAMARRPAERFASVEELREAVAAFLRHASSRALTRETEERLELLEAGAAQVPPEQLYAECRFGFRMALKEWPDNVLAQRGVERALVAMARVELARGRLAAAESLCAELGALPAGLEAALEEARRRQAEEERELARLKQLAFDSDLEVGAAWRATMVLILAAVFSLVPIVVWFGLRGGWLPDPSWSILLLPFIAGGTFAAIAWLKRGLFLVNRVNRQLAACLIGACACLFIHRLVALAHGVPAPRAIGQEATIVFTLCLAITICLDRRVAWATLVFFLTSIAVAAWPDGSLLSFGIGNGVGLLSLWKLWR